MAETCSSCGAELFAGQQFCRACGAPTRKFSTAEVPTQILPGAQTGEQSSAGRAGGQPAETTPLAPRDTGDPGYRSRLANYVPPAAPLAPAAPMVSGSRRGWLWALVAVLVASVTISAIVARQFAVHWAGKKKEEALRRVKVVVPKIEVPDVPLPPPLVLRGDEGVEGEPLDEEGAEVTSDKTVITETFPLGEEGRLSIVNVAGNITVEGWDGEEAEVRITKRGGTAADRAAAQIIRSESDDRITLRTAEGAHRLHEVRYEIKVPREVRQLEITARDSNVKIANVTGGLAVRVDRGDIELANVGGAASTHTMKGHTKVVLADAEPDDAQVFSGVNGDIELRLPPGINVQVKAQTIDGDIEADKSLKLDMQKRAAGWHAAGTVGRGGEPILVKTVSGNIKIKG
ncbi:MAG TPA: DUF4097 family beta strand repeat-containing protein [Pyrinomonadaceae bacterium]|nr:DUF4097 family beta strand repeat-containing protein [Pyrinomonadaceae bacterium]